MACSDYSTLAEVRDGLVEGAFFDAITCSYTMGQGMPGELLAFIVFGGVAIAMFIKAESTVMPLVLTILMGSIVLSQLPASAVQLGAIVIILMLGVAIYLIILWLDQRR